MIQICIHILYRPCQYNSSITATAVVQMCFVLESCSWLTGYGIWYPDSPEMSLRGRKEPAYGTTLTIYMSSTTAIYTSSAAACHACMSARQPGISFHMIFPQRTFLIFLFWILSCLKHVYWFIGTPGVFVHVIRFFFFFHALCCLRRCWLLNKLASLRTTAVQMQSRGAADFGRHATAAACAASILRAAYGCAVVVLCIYIPIASLRSPRKSATSHTAATAAHRGSLFFFLPTAGVITWLRRTKCILLYICIYIFFFLYFSCHTAAVVRFFFSGGSFDFAAYHPPPALLDRCF